MKSKTIHSLIVCLILTVGYFSPALAVTDAELEALEKQIEQQEMEVKKQTKSEEKKKAEAEAKRKAEHKRKVETEMEKKRSAELEQKKKEEAERKRLAEEMKRKEEEERLRAEKEKYDSHIKKAEAYMDDEKYNQAIEEYEQLLKSFPDDIRVLDGISDAQKYLNACNGIVGTWRIAPNYITWEVSEGNTVFGTWLIFNARGVWECLSASKREFVFSWPDCIVCATEYFILSDDNNTLQPTRGTGSIGTRAVDFKKDPTTITPKL